MEALIQIVRHTPVYVFLALAYGLFVGIRALRSRSMLVPTMPILPAVFLVLSIGSLISTASTLPITVFAWIVAVGTGVGLGASLLSANVLAVDRGRSRVTLGGDLSVLVLFVVFFGVKYFSGVVHATRPALASNPAFAIAMMVLSGISTGIMVGRIVKLYSVYFRTRAAVAA